MARTIGGSRIAVPKCALLVFIDDATGQAPSLTLCQVGENTFDYFHAAKAYLQDWGKPLAFYSDKHGIFRTTHASNLDRTSGFTQFGRALHELNIDIICANTPQAKGRVERANQTLQDRLVKELRLHDVSTIEAANGFAPAFIADFQRAFWQGAAQSQEHASPLAAHENLDGAMCRKEVRKLSQMLTLRYDKVLFILEPTDVAKRVAGEKVIVCDYPDGRLEVMHDGITLPYRTFDKLRSVQRSEVVENKRLDEVLAFSFPRCNPAVRSSAARADRAALARPAICLAFPTAARAMAIKSVNHAAGRIT
ncbi:ISNCY family transposase [Phyllobacterium sp. K27]